MLEDANENVELKDEDLGQIAGGVIMINPHGSEGTGDEWLIMHDGTDDVLAKARDSDTAWRIAKAFGQSGREPW